MKTAATILALAGAANAFAPASVKSSKNGLQMSVFDDYAGNVNFKGDEFNFDPVSLLRTTRCMRRTRPIVVSVLSL